MSYEGYEDGEGKVVAGCLVTLLQWGFGPFVLIWALNTLLPITIPITWSTWFAALLMILLFG